LITKIFTYFRYDPQLPFARRLIPVWEKAWREAGVTPMVVTNAPLFHQDYPQVLDRITKFPNTNPQRYEENNFMRWLTVPQTVATNPSVRGRLLMVDSDVFPTESWNPHALDDNRVPLTCLDASRCPCAVYLSAAGSCMIVDALLNTPEPTEHFSDQELFRLQDWPTHELVGNWPDVSKPLVHMGTNNLIGAGVMHTVHEKPEVISRILGL
jgi:hypothetical protein